MQTKVHALHEADPSFISRIIWYALEAPASA